MEDKREIDVFNDDDEFCLTQWGCLCAVLNDYGIDVSHLTPVMGVHMVDDFMDLMVRNGYVKKVNENEE